MNYFYGIIASYFLQDEDGSIIFYPWGFFGKGYIISDIDYKNKIRTTLKVFLLFSFPIICISTTGVILGYLYFIALPIVFIVLYFLKINFLLKGLSKSKRELNYFQALNTSAMAHDLIVLWALFIGSVILVLLSLMQLIIEKGSIFIGIIGIVFFSVGVYNSWYMIKIKSSHSAKKPRSPGSL